MQPLHNFQFLPWNMISKAASFKDHEDDQEREESPPVSPINPQRSQAAEDVGPPLDIPKGRQRSRKSSSSAANVTIAEPGKTATYRRLRLKHKGEETSTKKEKKEPVVVAEDYVAGFMDLRSRDSSAKGFSLSLSKEEIEKDFVLMTGKKPPQIPKKRKRSVQKRINELYLGSELKPVCTAEDYEVKVEESQKKRKRFR